MPIFAVHRPGQPTIRVQAESADEVRNRFKGWHVAKVKLVRSAKPRAKPRAKPQASQEASP